LTDSVQDELRKKLSASTVILTDKTRLSDNGNGTWSLQVNPFQQGGRPPCSGEKFANQSTGGWCSGFLVGSDIVVTADHCGRTLAAIEDTAYVFGFQASSLTDSGTTVFNNDQVYFGKDLLAFDLSDTGDFGIVRLDRLVTAPAADPLNVRSSGSLSVGSNLGVIGHPSGLPVKIAFGINTVLMRDDDPWLIANLDTYGGNSGSAVFNNDGEVEGILVRGAQDYEFDAACFRSNVIENSEGSEAVTKASAFRDKIPS
jgi:V8-like Glu-specific endopeptidase